MVEPGRGAHAGIVAGMAGYHNVRALSPVGPPSGGRKGCPTGIDDPLIKRGLALIARGGAAGVVQAGSVLPRAASMATTGGLGNPIVSTLEWIGAQRKSANAICAPHALIVGSPSGGIR